MEPLFSTLHRKCSLNIIIFLIDCRVVVPVPAPEPEEDSSALVVLRPPLVDGAVLSPAAGVQEGAGLLQPELPPRQSLSGFNVTIVGFVL